MDTDKFSKDCSGFFCSAARKMVLCEKSIRVDDTCLLG